MHPALVRRIIAKGDKPCNVIGFYISVLCRNFCDCVKIGKADIFNVGVCQTFKPFFHSVGKDACDSEYLRACLAQGIDNPVLVDKYMMGTELEVDVISDGTDVLIPGIMEHIERAGVHSGDSIAVYPPYNLNDIMTDTVIHARSMI